MEERLEYKNKRSGRIKGGNRVPQNGDFRGGRVIGDEKHKTIPMGG